MFGPDLDIYSVQFQRWGFLRWIWLPYQKSNAGVSCAGFGYLIKKVSVIGLFYPTGRLLARSCGYFISAVCLLFWQFSCWQLPKSYGI